MASRTLAGLLGVALPIVQAPMSGVDTPRLAAAVSEAGGLGSIAVGAIGAAAARQRMRETQALTMRPFNVNVFCHTPPRRGPAAERRWLRRLAVSANRVGASLPAVLEPPYLSFNEDRDMLQVLLEQRPGIVSFHFGLPAADRIDALHDAGIVLMASATTVQEAVALEKAGIDVIVAQGWEAGGHRGSFLDLDADGVGTMALVPQVADAVDRPVIAAGGIVDGRGIAAALSLGAAGVQLGTAFILCAESAASADYRAALVESAEAGTRVTRVLSGRPARRIAGAALQALARHEAEVPDYPLAYHAGKVLAEAGAAAGCFDYAPHWVGQGAPLCRPMPAGALVRWLAQSADAVLGTTVLLDVSSDRSIGS